MLYDIHLKESCRETMFSFQCVNVMFMQTAILALLMKYLGPKHTIIIGLVFEMVQLFIYGFGSQSWLMWLGGCVAAMGSITYPAISAFVSNHAAKESQGMYSTFSSDS